MMDDDCTRRNEAATAQDYDHLNNMSADEVLDEFTNVVNKMTEEKYDPAVIDAYLDVLDEKEPMDMSIDVEKEWENFSGAHGLATSDSSHERKVIRFGRVRWLAIIAATIAIMMTLTVSVGALGLHYFWDKLEWDEEHFSFGDAQYAEEAQEADAPLFENWDEGKVYGSLQEALDDFGITEFAEPTWLPEGYEYYGELYVYCDPEADILLMDARYDNEKYNVSVSITYSPPGERHNTWYQRSGDTYEEYICGDYTRLLFPNNATNDIVWITENYECCVSGWLTYDELIQIVDSIHLED